MSKYHAYQKADRANPKSKTCPCGNPAIAHRRGEFVCARCLAIEDEQDKSFTRNTDPRNRFSKYVDAFSINLPHNRRFA